MVGLININKDILVTLSGYKINKDEAILYLLGIYFGLDTSYISEVTRKQVNALNIIEREYKDNSNKPHTLKWITPLFSGKKEVQNQWEWVEQYRELFNQRNPERKGTKSAVLARMKKFFAENPEVRKNDVRQATEAYLRTVTDGQYLKSAHKFIYEGAGVNRISLLEQWVETVGKSSQVDGRSSKMG